MNDSPFTPPPAPGPGPRGPGSIISRTFALYGHNLLHMVVISATVTIPLIAAGLAAFGPGFMDIILGSPVGEDLHPLPASLLWPVAAYAALYVLGIVAVTAAIAQAAATALTGQPVSIGRAYSSALRRLPAIAGTSLLTGLAAGVPLTLAFLLGSSLSGPATVLLFIVTLLVGVYLLVRLVFAPFAALLEQAGPVAAMVKSWTLVSGMWLRTFAIFFLVTFLLGFVQLAFQAFGALIPGMEAFLTSLVVVPLTACADLLIYLDLRARKEGYSVDHMKTELEALSGAA